MSTARGFGRPLAPSASEALAVPPDRLGRAYAFRMAPELRHLRYLIAVAEHGGFSRAAEELHVSQPTLSQQVRQLERMVGADLLDRSGRTVRLTDAGAAYLEHARRAVREVDAAERAVHDVADLSRGHLRLAVTPTFTGYLVGPLIAELHRRHPRVTVDLTETTQDRIESGLLADTVDLGIGFDAPRLPGVEAVGGYTETLDLVAAAHTDAPADLELVLLSTEFATRRYVDAHFRTHDLSPHVVVQTDSLQALLDIVRHTGLATVLPAAVVDDHPDLVRLPLNPSIPPREVVLLRRTGASSSTVAAEFTDLVQEWAGARGYAE